MGLFRQHIQNHHVTSNLKMGII